MKKAVRLNAVTYPVEQVEYDLLAEADARLECIEGAKAEEIVAAAHDCDALLVVSSYIPAAVIEQLDRCRVISRLGAGVDRIDLAAAARRGMVVANVPDFCENEQAEHALALLLAWARKLPSMMLAMQRGDWSARHDPRVHRIAGQVLGLVGFGRSAQGLAMRARPLGMKLLAYARPGSSRRKVAEDLGVNIVDLEVLLRESDYLSIHLPLTEETRHFLNAERLALLKPTATIINTARGAIIDESALIAALRDGRIGGAALDTFETLDVFSQKTGPVSHPLLDLDNVLLTPHCAGSSVESTYDSKLRGARNAAQVLRGQPPESIVAGNWPPGA